MFNPFYPIEQETDSINLTNERNAHEELYNGL